MQRCRDVEIGGLLDRGKETKIEAGPETLIDRQSCINRDRETGRQTKLHRQRH